MSRKGVLFLAAIAAMTSMGIDMTLPGIPRMELDLGVRAGQGVLSASFFVAGFAMMPLLGGPLSDCFGRSRTLILSLLAFGLAALGCASAHSMSSLLAFRLMQGCASGIATTLPLAIVGDSLSGGPARQAMSEISTLSGIMPIVAPALGNGAIHLGGWRLLFGAPAVFSLVLAFPALRFPESLAVTSRQPLNPRCTLKNYRTLLSDPTLVTCALVFGLLFACTFCFTAVSPLILIQRLGMPRAVFAFVMAINAVGSFLGAATSAFLSKCRVSAKRIIFTGLVVTTTSTIFAIAIQWTQSAPIWGFLTQVFLAFFGFNLAGPSLLLEALKYVPTLLGSGSGLMRSIFMLMNFIASGLLGAYCVRHLPSTDMATTFSMAALAASAFVLYTWHTHRNTVRAARERYSH